MTMRFVIHCHNCSHGEIACDELHKDQRCPHCQSVPASYTDNGEEFCWLHRERLSGHYRVSTHFLFTEYTWRGRESQFPNAKLYEATDDEQVDRMSGFCYKCQEVFEKWLSQIGNEK